MSNLLKRFSLLAVMLTCSVLCLWAQNKTISGVVRDATDVVAGAAVTVQGTTLGAITDIDGKFQLSVPQSAKRLEVSFLGYDKKVVDLTSALVYDITLTESSMMLDEIVSIGYAQVRRKDLTGSSVSVSSNSLKQVPVTTAAQALAGKAAGVNVISQSGAPGADINITVRGGTSITQSTSPLYVVDGFVMENGLQNIDVQDIESIDVMKDASATAIYGARGSNGVILITTKSGQSGKTEVSYNAYWSFNHLGKKLNLLGVEDYVNYQYEFQYLRGNIDKWAGIFGGDINAPGFYTGAFETIHSQYANREGIDWQDEVFGNTGITQNHNVNISGGTDKTKYILSYNYNGEDGIMDKHDFSKNSIRAKIQHQLWKNVRFDFSTSFQTTRTLGGGSLGGSLKQTILQPVTGGQRWTNEEMIGSDLGDTFSAMYGGDNYDANNPIINNNAVTNQRDKRMYTMNAGIDIDIIKGLKWRTAGSYMWTQTRTDYWDDGTSKAATATYQSPYGWGQRNNSESYSYQISNTLNYNVDIAKEHHLGVLLGQETFYTANLSLNNTYNRFPDGNFGLNDVSMGTPYQWTSGKGREGLVSFFGRLSYNYKSRYYFTGTVRADGSSKFSRGNKWGSFPSGAVAWRLSEEDFMKDFDWLDNLKLRAGFGVTGNNAIDNNMYATSYGSGHYGIGGSDYITYVPGSTLGNENLKWEKTTSTNIGLDISVLASRVNLSVDWYNNKSDNLLIKNQIPSSTGYTHQYQNLGAIRNRGVEIVLNATPVKTRNFTWSSDFNIAFNRSKVLDLYGNDENTFWIQDYESRMGFKIEKDQPLGQFFGLVYDGVYTTDDFEQQADGSYALKAGVASLKGFDRKSAKPGDVKYQAIAGDTDADGNPVWSTNDRTVIGHAQPKFTGGWNNNFSYRGFDLNVFMTFVYGNDVFNMSTQRFIGPYLANQNTIDVMTDRFRLIDPNTGVECTDLQRLAQLNPQQYDEKPMWNISTNNKTAISDHSSYYIEDGSYLRLQTVTLGYTFPKKWLQQLHVANLRIYATANNLATFTSYTGYDPEVSATAGALTPGIDNSSYPRSKSWVVGLNLTF